MGVLGIGNNRNKLKPEPNQYIQRLKDKGITPIKIAACYYYSAVLFDNGRVCVWGMNDTGQLGLGNYAVADMYDIERVPTEIYSFSDLFIKDFKLAEDCSTFLTDDNRVFLAGLRLFRDPLELMVPKGAIVKDIFACKKSGGYITGNLLYRH